MPTTTIEYNYTIGAHFLGYLFNGDLSGLNDTEEDLVLQFERDLIGLVCEHNGYHYIVSVDNDDPYFGFESHFEQCDLTGLWGDCVGITVTII